MAKLNDLDKQALLKLARTVIAEQLLKGKSVERPASISPAMAEKRGCFVTLHLKKQLRGCIGTIEPVKPLINSVEDNALNAAFKDPRFSPLSAEELPGVNIEISVLTVPEPLEYINAEDLKAKLIPNVHGVILSKDWHHSTFLPQVWKQLPKKENFLAHLCQKAGLPQDAWKTSDLTIKTYQVTYFSE